MKTASKIKMTVFCVLIFAVGVLLIAFYLKQLNKAIEGITVSNIKQLAEHDLNSIELEVQNAWDDLSGVYTRIMKKSSGSIEDVFAGLEIERDTEIYEEIFLIDASGNTYSGDKTIKDSSDNEIVAMLLNGRERAAKSHMSDSGLRLSGETVAFAVRGEPFYAGDTEIIGIAGFIPTEILDRQINIRSFDGEGLSSVIDADGSFVINPDRDVAGGQENYFDTLQNNYSLSDEYISELKSRIAMNEEFFEIYKVSTFQDTMVCYKYMESTDWIFCMSVPASVVTSGAQPFVKMTAAAALMLTVLITGFFAVIILFVISAVNANSRAKAHSEFLSNMSHELRTPLNAIIGFNELMTRIPDDSEKAAEYLEKSGETAKYMLSLINDILDMSKIQAGKVDIENAPMSVSGMISTLEAIVRGRMDEKSIVFSVKTDIVSDNIIGDETHIEQILVNILTNAVKFTDENGLIEFTVIQSANDDGSVTTVYSVRDNGIGMSEEFQEKIFDAFSQERQANSDSVKGTGLGMALSSMFAKTMGGTLTVDSALGEGSTFTFTLTTPVSAENEKALPESVPSEAKQTDREPLSILVVEDNDLNAEILTDMLSLEGMNVVRAEDGKKALDMFKESEHFFYDLILMDIQMPVMNGYDSTRAIRSLDRPDAKYVLIYACSANTFLEDKEKAYESGMNDYITKPIDMGKLMVKLGSIRKGSYILRNGE